MLSAKLYLKVKILIVDDDKSVRTFLENWLEAKGYQQILSAETGEEALKIIGKEKDINLVFLDIRLPGIDGIEVLRQIKKINKDIGVIMITAFADEEATKAAAQEGAYEYIMKPFDLAYLELSVFTKIIDTVKSEQRK